ncbi:hypothetical protein [Clostridium sp. JNZ J1-5]
MKKIVSLLFTLTLLLSIFTVTAFAKDKKEYSKVPTSGTPAKSVNASEKSKDMNDVDFEIESVVGAGSIINWYCAIAEISSGQVLVTGLTQANSLVDEIGYSLVLERWYGYDWVSVSSYSNYSKDNLRVTTSYSKYVEKNAYYRVRGTHYVIENGVKTTKVSESEYIFVE